MTKPRWQYVTGITDRDKARRAVDEIVRALYAPAVASQATPHSPDGGDAGIAGKRRRRPPTAKQKRAREQFGKVWPQLVKDEARKLRDEGR